MDTSKKRKFEPTPNESHDFFEVKPTLKLVKPNPNPSIPSQTENKPTKSAARYGNQQLLTKFIPVKRQFSLGTGHVDSDSVLISYWNINGLKRIVGTGQLQSYFKARMPDILCLNEIKIEESAVEAANLTKWIPPEYTCYYNSSKTYKAYSGVSIFTKYKPMSVQYGMGIEKHDKEGRLITLEFETFYMVVCYVPFSGMGFKRIEYRINEWDPALRAYLVNLKAKKPVIIGGDFNVAHQVIDMWCEGEDFIGSSTPERNSFGKLLEAGYVDTFRYVYPEVRRYSWWNLAKGNKEKNRGRRFDYVLASEEAVEGIKDAFVNSEVNGSDHCPVELLFNPNFEQKKEEEQQKGKQEDKQVIVID